MPNSQNRPGAEPVVAITAVLSLVAVVALNWDVVQSLQARWSLSDQSPGYLVIFLACYLGWRLMPVVASKQQGPSILALFALLGVTATAFAASAVQVQVVQQLMLPIQIGLMIAAVLGWASARSLLPALVMLVFAIPLFEFLNNPLRDITVTVTRQILQWWQIPALIDGYYITVPAGRFFVAGSCSGLNYFVAGGMIGYLHAYLHFHRRLSQILIIALALALAVLSNWIRVTSLVFIGFYTEMQSELVYHHGNFGIAVFAGTMLAFFALTQWASSYKAIGAVDTAMPLVHRRGQMAYGVVALLILALPSLWPVITRQLNGGDAAPLEFVDPAWRPVKPESWQPEFSGHDYLYAWSVARDGREWLIYELTYRQQRQGKEMIYYSNVVAPEDDVVRPVTAVQGRDSAFNQAVVRRNGGARIVWWTYRVADHYVARDYEAKALQLWAVLTGNPSTAAIFVSTNCAQANCAYEKSDPEIARMRDRLLSQLIHRGNAGGK